MNRFREGFTSTSAAAGLVALLLTTTGTAVAAPLVIGSQQIKNHSITAVDIKPGSLNGTLIGNGTITGLDIKDGSLSRADIAGSTITGKQVKNKSITSADIDTSGLSVPKATNADNARTVNGVSTTVVERSATQCTDATATSNGGVTVLPRVHWGIYIECVGGPKDSAARWQLRYFLLDSGTTASGEYRECSTTCAATVPYASAAGYSQGLLGDSSELQTWASMTFVEPGNHLLQVQISTQASDQDQTTMRYQMVITERG